MAEVVRMLRGGQWADLEAERRQHQEFKTAACVLGILVLLGFAFRPGR